jgi:hypothetical protein
MTDLFLFAVTLVGWLVVVGTIVTTFLLIKAVEFIVEERRERVRLQRRARRAAQAYGLHLVAGSRDELADRRARRGGGRVA